MNAIKSPLEEALNISANPIIIVEKQAAFIPLVLTTVLLFIIAFALDFALSSFVSASNWSEMRCQPHVMPLASFYGYDAVENFNYCVTNVMAKKASKSFGPLYKIVEIIMTVMSNLVGSANSLQMQLATLMGGIYNIFQEFGQRITQFMFRIQLTAQRIKMLMGRVYASMFSVIYMGLSGVTAVNNLADSTLIKFLNFFCFAPETIVYIKGKGSCQIKNVCVDDILYSPHNPNIECCVTARHSFIGDGQPVVHLGNITVSTNHYVLYNGTYIPAGEHPNAVPVGEWSGGTVRPFICFNTHNNIIPIDQYIFRDYDETHTGDIEGVQFADKSLNSYSTGDSSQSKTAELMQETAPGIAGDTQVKMQDGSFKKAADLQLGDNIFSHNSTQSARIIGRIIQQTAAYCIINNNKISATTLIWYNNKWVRAHTISDILYTNNIFYGFIVSPSNTLIIGESELILRDHIEVMSPFAEDAYSTALSSSVN